MLGDWKEILYFTKQERLGIGVLGGVALLFVVGSMVMSYWVPKPANGYTQKLWAAVPTLDTAAVSDADIVENEGFTNNNRGESSENGKQAPVVLVAFDPNTIGREEWIRLGIPRFVADRIEKYRKAGGSFKKADDVRKIYGLSDADFERLKPYITIAGVGAVADKETAKLPTGMWRDTASSVKGRPSGAPPKVSGGGSVALPKVPLRVDINAGDAGAFERLYGIGAVLAERIVKYRNALGGFERVEQVREVWGLPDSTYQKIVGQLVLGAVPLERININTADVTTLDKHPYLDKKQAQAIVNYRTQHGNFGSVTEIAEVKALPADVVKKITPYLRTN